MASGLFRHYFFVLIGNGTAGLLSFAISVLLSKSMSLEGFGIYSLFVTIMFLVWQIPAFLDSAYVRYARAASGRDADDYLRVDLVLKTRVVGLIAVLSPVLAFGLSRWVYPGKISSGMILVAVISGGFLTFLTSLMAYFQSTESFTGYAFGNIVFYLLTLFVFILLARGGPIRTGQVASVFLVLAAVSGGVGFAWLARRIRPLLPLRRECVARLMGLGRWILFTGLLYIVLQRLDVLVVGHLFSKEDVGVYGAAARLLSALTIFISAAAFIYLPKAAVAVGSKAAWRSYWRGAVLLTAGILLVLALLWLAAPRLVSLFFGPRYAGATAPMRALFIGHMPQVFALPFAYILYGIDDSFSNFAAMAICLAVNFGFNAVFTPRLGLVGPGWAFAAGYSAYLAAILGAVFLNRKNRKRLSGLK